MGQDTVNFARSAFSREKAGFRRFSLLII